MAAEGASPRTKPAVRRRTGRVSKRVNAISPSGIRKYFDLLDSLDGVISLGVGEPDYATPWHIIEPAIESLHKGQTMYTPNSGMPELRQELARYLRREHGLDYDPATELLITVGVSEGLDLAMRAILNPGDEVIIPDPCYVSYEPCVVLAGGKTVAVPTREEDAFALSAAEVEARITPRTRAILIGYPANPTGAVMGRERMLELTEVAKRHNLTIVSDEIYAKLVYGVEHTCVAALPGMQPSTILLGGFSKAYAMTGWRIAYAAAPKDLIAAMTKIHQYTMMCVPTMAQVAAIEALHNGDRSVADMVDDYNRRRLVMVNGLRDIGLSCFEPKGAFYAFPSIRSTGLTSEEFAEGLLTEEKVVTVPGSAFGAFGEGYVRCCYATSMADIEEALTRMRRFVKRHRA
jgi:aminotransferase